MCFKSRNDDRFQLLWRALFYMCYQANLFWLFLAAKKRVQMNLRTKSILLTVIVAISVQTAAAQEPAAKRNNKVSLNGEEYYMHIVSKGETLSAISRAYEVPVDTIIADNPQLTYQIHLLIQFLQPCLQDGSHSLWNP